MYLQRKLSNFTRVQKGLIPGTAVTGACFCPKSPVCLALWSALPFPHVTKISAKGVSWYLPCMKTGTLLRLGATCHCSWVTCNQTNINTSLKIMLKLPPSNKPLPLKYCSTEHQLHKKEFTLG